MVKEEGKDTSPEIKDSPSSRRLSSSFSSNMTSKTRSAPPQSLPPGAIAQAQAQFPVALVTQLQLTTKASSSPSPPTLNLVPATPGLASSKPSTSDLSPNPSTLSKHKGLPVLPYLVTPKEEKSHAAILGLWEYDESSGKSSAKVSLSSKGPPSTSGSSKVATSMGAEGGRKALLALQSVAAEEGAPLSIGKCQTTTPSMLLTQKEPPLLIHSIDTQVLERKLPPSN
jgi:hypothetical protein